MCQPACKYSTTSLDRVRRARSPSIQNGERERRQRQAGEAAARARSDLSQRNDDLDGVLAFSSEKARRGWSSLVDKKLRARRRRAASDGEDQAFVRAGVRARAVDQSAPTHAAGECAQARPASGDRTLRRLQATRAQRLVRATGRRTTFWLAARRGISTAVKRRLCGNLTAHRAL